MLINGIIWLADIIDKLERKHAVATNEVENIFDNLPVFHGIERGNVKGEHVYRALEKTDSGRYIVVFFIYKRTHEALVISARDMTEKRGGYMQKANKNQNYHRDTLPVSFDSIADAADFWESHDSADYEDFMEDVQFNVDINRHVYLVPVAESVLEKVRKKAKHQGVSTEKFVNMLLQEHA